MVSQVPGSALISINGLLTKFYVVGRDDLNIFSNKGVIYSVRFTLRPVRARPMNLLTILTDKVGCKLQKKL